MGLTFLGSGNPKAIDEMTLYAHETQHEKIIRGLAIGLALLMYNLEEQADPLIQQLLLDKGKKEIRNEFLKLTFFSFLFKRSNFEIWSNVHNRSCIRRNCK